jgi:uncharacterized protein YjbJ (UPF0337 family)
MSNANKHEGIADQVGGKIKAVIGKLIGSGRMRAEGEAQILKGKAREEAAKAVDVVKETAEVAKEKIDEAKAAVKNRVGAAGGASPHVEDRPEKAPPKPQTH